MEMIRLEHVTKSFDNQKVLDDFSISIEEGEFLTVIGRSGCGKTTMLKTINGLHRPEQGRVYVEGKDISKEDLIAVRRKIGYVIQNKGLFPHMTVEKNITYVPVISGKKEKKANHELACRLIKTVGLDSSMLSRYPSELSGGQQQRVGITIVFITHDIREAMKLGSRVLVMDKGKIVQLDTPEKIKNEPVNEFVYQLVGQNLENIIE